MPLTPSISETKAVNVRHILTAKSFNSIGSVDSAIAAAISAPAELFISESPERYAPAASDSAAPTIGTVLPDANFMLLKRMVSEPFAMTV